MGKDSMRGNMLEYEQRTSDFIQAGEQMYETRRFKKDVLKGSSTSLCVSILGISPPYMIQSSMKHFVAAGHLMDCL